MHDIEEKKKITLSLEFVSFCKKNNNKSPAITPPK